MKLTRLITAAVVAMALPLTAKAQDVRGPTQIDTTLRLDRQGTVDLSLISGRIRVTGWDRQEVKISASVERGVLQLDANTSRINLTVDMPEGSRRHNLGDARYDVSVPRGTRLILEGVSANISATGSEGEIEANSVSGDVEITGGTREVNVESVSGSVRASQVNGNLRAESVSGDVRIENVSGNVEASSVSGGLRLVGVQSKDVRTETVSGDVLYAGNIDPNGKYSFESHSGTLRLDILRGAGAQFSVETFSGDIDTDFPVTMRPGQTKKQNGRLEFSIGDGRARVSAQTFSGRILINSSSDSTTRRDDE